MGSPTERALRLLFGRQEERRVLDALVVVVRDGLSGSLVLVGEPGVGKTRLLDYVAESAVDLRVLRTAGSESETQLGFAGLHRLLAPLLDRVEILPGPQQDALCSVCGLTEGTAPNRFLVGLATLTLLVDAAEARPVVCLVDDAQWLDPESLAVLGFIGRRLRANRIGMVFCARDDETSPPALDGLPVRQLSGLTESDARELLASRVAGRLDGQVAQRLAVATGGNPLALMELADELSDEQLAGRAALPAPLPVGRRLEGVFLKRVQSLPVDTRLLLLVAAAEPPRVSGVLWRAAAMLGISARAADAAVSVGILSLHPHIDFAHPLMRSAVYSGASAEDRRWVHAALAEALDDDHDLDRRAWHLAAGVVDPDEKIAAELERGAERARGRGGYAAQAASLVRAAELTPDGETRTRRLLGAASAHLIAGHPIAAEAVLEQAAPELTGPLVWAQAQRLRAAVEQGCERMRTVSSILLDAVRITDGLDRGLAREMLFDALHAALLTGEYTMGTTPLEVARTARSFPQQVDRPSTVRDFLLDGFATRLTEGYVAAVPLLRAAIDTLCSDDEIVESSMPLTVMVLSAAGELWDDGCGRRILSRLNRVERDHGALFGLRMTLLGQAYGETLVGRFAAAEALHAEYDEITTAIGLPSDGPIHTVELLAWQGNEAQARAAARSAIEEGSKRRGIGVLAESAFRALALLELGFGRYREALEYARRVFATDSPAAGVNRVLVDLVEAGARGGDPAAAGAALARLAERATASGTSWALGQLARGRAILADDDAAEALYRQSIACLEDSIVATDRARSHLVYGEWLRRRHRRDDARRELRTAYDAFVHMGAVGFAERARNELVATGERARRRTRPPDLALTPQETQIARLVTEGATNAEIAGRLSITTSTVEYHLNKIFRKLDLTSRRQLARALRDPSTGGPDPQS